VSEPALAQFCALVLSDASLQEVLLRPAQAEEFVARVVEQGRKRGLVFDGAAVEAAMRANRQALTVTWIDN